MTNSVNGSVSGSTLNNSQLFGDAIMVSLQSNKKASVLTVKNYNTEAELQKSGIQQAVKNNTKSYNDEVEQDKKAKRHKIIHAVLGTLFHIIRLCTRPVKAIRKDVSKAVTHSVEKAAGKEISGGLMSRMFHAAADTVKKLGSKISEPFKPAKDMAVKFATSDKVSDRMLDILDKTALAGEAGMHIDNGIYDSQTAKTQESIELLNLAKDACEKNYELSENEKKQEMQHLSSYLSNRSETLKMVDQLINNKGSVQAQIASSI